MVTHLVFLALGAVKLLNLQTENGKMITIAVLGCTLVAAIGAAVFRSIGNFDIVDEAAKEHYDRSKRKVFDFIWGLIGGLAIGLVLLSFFTEAGIFPVEITFTINAWWLMILYGMMQIAISVQFIRLEKRDA